MILRPSESLLLESSINFCLSYNAFLFFLLRICLGLLFLASDDDVRVIVYFNRRLLENVTEFLKVNFDVLNEC